MNGADALNAPSALAVMGRLLPAFIRSLTALPAVTVKEVAETLGLPSKRKKADTVEAVKNRLSDAASAIPVWPNLLTAQDVEKMAASGALGSRVGQVVRMVRFDDSDMNTAWARTADFVNGRLAAKKADAMLDSLSVTFDSDIGFVATNKTGIERHQNAVGEYDSVDWSRWTDRPMPQAHREEWRLACSSRRCYTPSGIRSFVRAVGMGASTTKNPRTKQGGIVPATLFGDDGNIVVINTTDAQSAARCPTCGSGVKWATRYAGGSSSRYPVGGWGSKVRLPAIKWPEHAERESVSNRLVKVEMNNASPRTAITFDASEGIEPFGRYGSGYHQRHGYDADPDAFDIINGRKKGRRKTAQLPGSIRRFVGIVATENGGRVPVLMWAFVHDPLGLSRGIDNADIDYAVAMVEFVATVMRRSSKMTAHEGAVLLDAISRLKA